VCLELEELVLASLVYRMEKRIWECTRCGKESTDKARIRRHAEVEGVSRNMAFGEKF
jgi:ribosomal protein L37AE/L43A